MSAGIILRSLFGRSGIFSALELILPGDGRSNRFRPLLVLETLGPVWYLLAAAKKRYLPDNGPPGLDGCVMGCRAGNARFGVRIGKRVHYVQQYVRLSEFL